MLMKLTTNQKHITIGRGHLKRNSNAKGRRLTVNAEIKAKTVELKDIIEKGDMMMYNMPYSRAIVV